MMKKFVGALLVAALASVSQGCGMFDKKEEEKPKTENGGGDAGGGQQQGGMDPLTFVNAPGNVWLGPDAKVGMMGEQSTEAGGTTSVMSYAIVGESGDSWLVESVHPSITAMAGSFPDLKGMILGLTVKKADGVVTKAVAGKPGEAGKDVKIGPAAAPQTAAAPKGTPDKCTIGIGTFDAVKYENSGVNTWVGTSGAVKDTMLKMDGANGFELAEQPKDEDLDIGGTKVKCHYTAYTNGMKTWMTEDALAATIFGGAAAPAEGQKRMAVAKTEGKDYKMAITALKTDAKPQLKW